MGIIIIKEEIILMEIVIMVEEEVIMQEEVVIMQEDMEGSILVILVVNLEELAMRIILII